MALTRLLLLLVVLWPAVAVAQDAGAELVPPHPLAETTVPYPEGAPAHDQPIVVRIKMLVDTDGSVNKVDLVAPAGSPWDEAVVAAAKTFRFEPGRYQGNADRER